MTKGYDATKRRSFRQGIKNKLNQVLTVKEGAEAGDAVLKVGMAATIIGLQTYLLRMVVVPTPGMGQITLPGGGAAFLTYQGKQIQTLQFTFPQHRIAEDVLAVPIVALIGATGGNAAGTLISVGSMAVILGDLLSNFDDSLFFEKVWQLNDIWVDMGSPVPGGTGVVEIKVDAWVAGKRMKFIALALGVGAMSYWGWTKMGGALLR